MDNFSRDLDRWITDGRYSKSVGYVICPACEESTDVIIETEYGATEWSTDNCKHCGAPFPENIDWYDAEPDPPYDTIEEMEDYYGRLNDGEDY